MSDSESGSPGFESRYDRYLDLFYDSPEFKSSATLVNSQLVCLRSVGILNNVVFSLNYLLQLFACNWPTSNCAIKLPRVNEGLV